MQNKMWSDSISTPAVNSPASSRPTFASEQTVSIARISTGPLAQYIAHSDVRGRRWSDCSPSETASIWAQQVSTPDYLVGVSHSERSYLPALMVPAEHGTSTFDRDL